MAGYLYWTRQFRTRQARLVTFVEVFLASAFSTTIPMMNPMKTTSISGNIVATWCHRWMKVMTKTRRRARVVTQRRRKRGEGKEEEQEHNIYKMMNWNIGCASSPAVGHKLEMLSQSPSAVTLRNLTST